MSGELARRARTDECYTEVVSMSVVKWISADAKAYSKIIVKKYRHSRYKTLLRDQRCLE